MKKRLPLFVAGVALALLNISCQSAGSGGDVFSSAPRPVERFAMDSKENILQNPHLWVNTGAVTVNPDLTSVGGWRNVVVPPWASSQLRGRLSIDGEQVKLADYQWMPGEFRRHGFSKSDVEVRTLLSPMAGERGFVELVELKNTTDAPMRTHVSVECKGNFGRVADDKWGFPSVTGNRAFPACQLASTQPGWLEAKCADAAVIAACDLPKMAGRGDSLEGDVELAAGGTRTFAVAFAAGEPQVTRATMKRILSDPAKAVQANRQSWADRIEKLYRPLPKLTSSNKELVDFYDRSVLTYLIARWELPELNSNPWVCTAGLDGGALCLYVWDYSYAAMTNTIAEPEITRGIIERFIKANLLHAYAIGPIKGEPKGVWYAYNHYSLIRIIHEYILATGDVALLDEVIDGKTVLDWAITNATYLDDLSKPVDLVDYGTNKNLLELHLTENYTHYVPSPNGERCWSMCAVDEMAKWAGKPDPGLSKRAGELEKVIREKLWSPGDGWLYSLSTAHKPMLGYSIQVFDLLRLDILTQEQRDAIVKHLNEKEFLSKWGVHSYSKSAPGYDETDVDWGGPGVFVADAPELVNDLLHAGYTAQADDLFSRILWWGQSMPYYPQAIRADDRGYRTDGRSNEIAGGMGAQLVIVGLLGMQVQIDGTVTIKPHLPSFAKDMKLAGVQVRGHRFDVEMDTQGYTVTAAGHRPIKAQYGTTTRVPRA